ncbi:MAG: DUF4298 domain-containing protein [Firmicutes bacterium]|nr:DUF4298 domain-containing protein [Bacillota bacterium]
MNKIERISYHESLMNQAEKAIHQLDEALEQFPEIQKRLNILDGYYTSTEWMEDFEASERGEIPEDVPCGVLSEDGIYNLLEKNRELIDLMKEISEKFGRKEA